MSTFISRFMSIIVYYTLDYHSKIIYGRQTIAMATIIKHLKRSTRDRALYEYIIRGRSVLLNYIVTRFVESKTKHTPKKPYLPR